jgi:tRNA modification GTPase
VLNESIDYKGIKFNFVDTAGIRNSDDKVEKIGIKKSKEAIDQADAILFVLDGSREMNDFDSEIKELLTEKQNVLTIVNKNDQKRILPQQKNEISISALNQNNIESIKQSIFDLVIKEKIDYQKTIVTNERQMEILSDSEKILDEILASKNESMDIVALLIKSLWNTLGKITGECENERIIDLIFSKFCLGK